MTTSTPRPSDGGSAGLDPGTNQQLGTEGLKREVGFFGLLWASEASIIGSGWLFGALTAVGIAGPSALIAWVIGTAIILLIALVHAELGGLFPVSGGTSRFPHYAFGSMAGMTFGWLAYVQAAATGPIEVLAAIQYMSSYKSLESLHLYSDGKLSGWGIVFAVVLMIMFTAINLVGVAFLSRVNGILTVLKIALPLLTIVVLLTIHLHASNFTAGGGFFVHGAAFKSIILAIPGAIIFSLLGFEQAVQIGGESKNPSRDLPRAVIMSVILGAAIYIGVQIAFIGALDPALLAHGKTWAGLVDPTTTNAALVALQGAPFYEVATLAGVAWLAALLRIDAIISPSGTGLIYLTSSSRVSFALSKNGFVPKIFEQNSMTQIPVVGILVSSVIGLVFLLPFPSWSSLVGTVTSASVLMYAGAPLAFGALRQQKPDLPRSFRLPAGQVLGPVAFILANFIVMWSGWGTYTTLMLALLIGYAFMGTSRLLNLNDRPVALDWESGKWIPVYLIGMGAIIYFTSYGNSGIIGGVGVFAKVWVGGNGQLSLGWDMLVMALFSVAVYFLAMACRLSPAQVDHNVRDVYPTPTDAA